MADYPLDQLQPDPLNVRRTAATDQATIDLVASVREQGILQALLIRPAPEDAPGPQPFMVVCGHRRFAAAQAAGLTTVPAELREFASEGAVRLAQAAENMKREDMTALDIWGAVEAAVSGGMSEAAVALAMNLTDRAVRQYAALGSMAEPLVAYMRSSGNLPAAHHARVICQASPQRQIEVFTALGAGRTHIAWGEVAHEVKVTTIPMGRARFDRTLYQGPIHHELFPANEEDAEQAMDVDQFIGLQRAWASEEVARRKRAGFADAVVAQPDKYGLHPAPAGCFRHRYQTPDEVRKKSERAGFIYSVLVTVDGQVDERIWPKPTEEERKRDEALQATATRLGEPLPKPPKPFTEDGVARIEAAKREAAVAALQYQAGEPWNLLWVAVCLLRNKVSVQSAAPSIEQLYEADGTFDFDREDREEVVTKAALDILGFHLEAKDRAGTWGKYEQPLPTVERIGEGLMGAPMLPRTEEVLRTFSRAELEELARRINQPLLPKVGALRAAIAQPNAGPKYQEQPVISHAELPALAWKVEPRKREEGEASADAEEATQEVAGGEEETEAPAAAEGEAGATQAPEAQAAE